jgi:hypothetical protein
MKKVNAFLGLFNFFNATHEIGTVSGLSGLDLFDKIDERNVSRYLSIARFQNLPRGTEKVCVIFIVIMALQ